MNTLVQLTPANISSTTDNQKLLSINFLEKKNFLSIKGWSVTPELQIVYSVLLEEIQEHLATREGITINLGYEVFNTWTTQFLFKAIKNLNTAAAQGKHVAINWVTKENNIELYEMGMDLQGLCDFDFRVSLEHHTIFPSFN